MLISGFSMIVIAVFVLMIFHPGFGFQNKFNELKYRPVRGAEAAKENISLMAEETAYAR